MKIVYATATVSVATPGGYPALVRGGTHWSADDPLVRAHPDLFSDDPRWGLTSSVPLDDLEPPVEQATASPGEKRSTSRRG